ncbi:LysR family transcriptional regulator [Streptomyces sp. 5-8]|uniref:LysR family transcriptional regulator n=1 Tax=Streptomyces musisoli TaxID=2802280 RepID=A0ABS1NVQ9_9ACTN|nr:MULTISPECIES: LysR family transcriptional regulator [Streptomyces]MBL1104195.1 LysR family transcriptional regulator [Streptomyces musisoli]MBY8840268.1 LysR family transcriptional regulator [Streptomyces sp. SP2-10]
MDLLAHLEAYVATADEASFSRAADRLGIAQPLLSRRIKTLEEHFGGLLFDRSRRQISATELGVLLLPYARDVLDRAQRLRHVARSARSSRVRAVGVPADCAPAALARAIRAGSEHGITLGMRELSPSERESGLVDGSLGYALVRTAPERAAFRAPLGLATAPEPDAEGSGVARPTVHLEELRPRRGRAVARTAPPPLLLLTEDQVPCFEDRLARAAARAGLPEGRIRPAGPAATALAETLAGRALLLCTEPFARQHGARWTPLADRALHRGYDVRGAPGRSAAEDVPGRLAALLAAAVGATADRHGGPQPGAGDEDVLARLAARG